MLSKEEGIGQILESLAIRPSFTLLAVGREESAFWRRYRLEGPGEIPER